MTDEPDDPMTDDPDEPTSDEKPSPSPAAPAPAPEPPNGPQDPAYDYCREFFTELARNGLRHVVCSPGARSAPLVLSAHSAGLQVLIHHDERSGGFFALGLAKQIRSAAALICTSGSAAANYFPAVVEAYYDGAPLLILTADRPPELRDRGAGQTIDQIRLYGSHVRWFAELPVPSEVPVQHARYAARRAFAEASGGRPGPVHLNFPFREPLEPRARHEPEYPGRDSTPSRTGSTLEPRARHESDPLEFVETSDAQERPEAHSSDLGRWRAPSEARSGRPAQLVVPPGEAPVELDSRWQRPSPPSPPVPPAPPAIGGEAEELAAIIRGCERGLLVAGPSDFSPETADQIIKMAALAGWPVLADAASNLRFRPSGQQSVSPANSQPDEQQVDAAPPDDPQHNAAHPDEPQHDDPQPAEPHPDASQLDTPTASAIKRRSSDQSLTTLAEPARSVVVTTGTHLAVVKSFWDTHEPEVILRIGHPPTTRTLREGLASFSSLNLLVDPSSRWEEPETFPDRTFASGEGPLCAAVVESLTISGWERLPTATEEAGTDRLAEINHAPTIDLPAGDDLSSEAHHSAEDDDARSVAHHLTEVEAARRVAPVGWLADWQKAENAALAAIAASVQTDPLLEAGVARTLGEALPAHATLYVSNSMPVRDLDAFLAPRPLPLRVTAQRGVSGIDGVVSAALGMAAGSEHPVVLYAGDLALLHDVGGLLRGVKMGIDLTIVVPNNNGGGVFSFLPISDAVPPEEFRKYFHTPHDVDLARLLTGMGVRHRLAHTADELKHALAESIASGGIAVVEVPVDAAANVAEHRLAAAAVSRAVEEVLGAAGGTSRTGLEASPTQANPPNRAKGETG